MSREIELERLIEEQKKEIEYLRDRVESVEDCVISKNAIAITPKSKSSATEAGKIVGALGLAFIAFMMFLFLGISIEGEYKTSKYAYNGQGLLASLLQLTVAATGVGGAQYALERFKGEVEN